MRLLSRSSSALALCLATPGLDAQVRWQSLLPERSSQTLRYHVKSACWDSLRGRLLTLDEIAGSSVRYALFAVDAAGRTRLGDFPGRPSGTIRVGFDPKRDRVVALIQVPSVRYETWEWDGSTWAKTLSSGALALEGSEAGLHWDASRARIAHVHNGTSSGGRFAVFEYDGKSWSERPLAGAPRTATSSCAAFDDAGRILLYTIDDARQVSVCWWMEGGRWLALSGAAPAPRTSPAMCFDATRRRFVLHGGQWQRKDLAETWEWNGAWRERASAGGPLRWGHSIVPGPAPSALVGGFTFLPRNGIRTHDEVFAYRVLRPASARGYGSACGGASAPLIRVEHLPWAGEDARFAIDGATRASASLVLTGSSAQRWGALPLPLDLSGAGMPACLLLTSPELALATTARRFAYRVPATTDLLGARYHHQVASFVSGANPAGLTWSRGLELRVGAP